METEPTAQLALAVNQRQPSHRPIRVETRDGEHAVIQKVSVRRAVFGIVFAGGNKTVDIFEILIVPRIDNDATVVIDDNAGAFVLEATEGRPFHRRVAGPVRIDFDHPAEPIGFVRFLDGSKRLSVSAQLITGFVSDAVARGTAPDAIGFRFQNNN